MVGSAIPRKDLSLATLFDILLINVEQRFFAQLRSEEAIIDKNDWP